jgi:aldehyde:ferredoxin oxidoreductase
MSSQYGGWTGKTLRVDLTTGAITTVDTVAKYKDYLGGTGLGYKVLWDEVPPGTPAFDPANRIIFATGPITATGAPSAGRLSITSVLPYADLNDLPGAGHMGGHFGPEFKYAGWDAIIIQGAATKPVWLQIIDSKVTIVDASQMWGNGTTATNDQICTIMGSTAQVAAIGPIGEQLGRMSCVINDRCHSAGAGLGAVMGSKNLKAIGVIGTGSVPIFTDAASWKKLINYYLSLIGANNNNIVPKTQQPWSAYYDNGSRWSANKGVYWGAARPELETGICSAFDKPVPVDCPVPMNKMGLRTQKGFNDFGIPGMNHTVKMNGCHGCPIRCHISMDIAALEAYDVPRYNEETCIGYTPMSSMMTTPAGVDGTVLMNNMSANLCNDFGLWTDYGAYSAIYGWCMTHAMTADEVAFLQNPSTIDPGMPAAIPANGLNINGLPYVGRTPFQNNLPAAELVVLGGAGADTLTYAQLLAAHPIAAGTPYPWAANTPWGNANAGNVYALQQLMYLLVGKQAPASSGGSAAPVTTKTSTPTLADVVVNGPPYWQRKWPEVLWYTRHNKAGTVFKMGHMKHHGVESFGQVGLLINTVFNRDPMNHTHQNILVGPPLAMREKLMDDLFSSPTAQSLFNDPAGSQILCDAVTVPYAPMTLGKAAFAAASLVSVEIKNALVHCDWMFPTWMSPLASKNYAGDFTIEAQIYSAVTGDIITANQMELIGWRCLTLYRCLNAAFMNYYSTKSATNPHTVNMRVEHDQPNPWMFETSASPANAAAKVTDAGANGTSTGWCYAKDTLPFKGDVKNQMMDQTDYLTGLTMMHGLLGWDAVTGMPTAATLTKLGLSYVQAAIPTLIK